MLQKFIKAKLKLNIRNQLAVFMEDTEFLQIVDPFQFFLPFKKFFRKLFIIDFLDFLNKYNILSDSQYGFRKHHSTVYALTHLYDKISFSIDNKQFTVGIFTDLSKPFDTVSRSWYFTWKLEHYCIRTTGTSLKWFCSYLNDRKQFVEFHGHCSTANAMQNTMRSAVYINDLCNVSDVLDFILFEDYTNIFFPINLMIWNFYPKLLIMN